MSFYSIGERGLIQASFLMISTARQDSGKFSGKANQSIAAGKTHMYQLTIPISNNPANQPQVLSISFAQAQNCETDKLS
jgi:hypothetical protein